MKLSASARIITLLSLSLKNSVRGQYLRAEDPSQQANGATSPVAPKLASPYAPSDLIISTPIWAYIHISQLMTSKFSEKNCTFQKFDGYAHDVVYCADGNETMARLIGEEVPGGPTPTFLLLQIHKGTKELQYEYQFDNVKILPHGLGPTASNGLSSLVQRDFWDRAQRTGRSTVPNNDLKTPSKEPPEVLMSFCDRLDSSPENQGMNEAAGFETLMCSFFDKQCSFSLHVDKNEASLECRTPNHEFGKLIMYSGSEGYWLTPRHYEHCIDNENSFCFTMDISIAD